MESLPSMVKEEVCVKEEPPENCADSSGASEEAAWGPELSVKGELEAGPESLPPTDVPLTDTDEKPKVLFELFEDGPTTVQPRPAAVSAVSARSVYARARQQLAMTCVVRLERHRQSQCQPWFVTTDHEASATTHMKAMHTYSAGEKACTCDTCREQFTSEFLFAEHSRRHKAAEVYSCKICSKVFSCKYHLNRHVAVHTGRKPYSCEICNKYFTRKDHLREHIRAHTGQKSFKCEICNKLFRENSKLTIHTRIHTGQKPYKCEICNKQFTQNTNLNQHLKIHIGQKPYECELCNKRFTYKSALNYHIRNHTKRRRHNETARRTRLPSAAHSESSALAAASATRPPARATP